MHTFMSITHQLAYNWARIFIPSSFKSAIYMLVWEIEPNYSLLVHLSMLPRFHKVSTWRFGSNLKSCGEVRLNAHPSILRCCNSHHHDEVISTSLFEICSTPLNSHFPDHCMSALITVMSSSSRPQLCLWAIQCAGHTWGSGPPATVRWLPATYFIFKT